jgi:hypothetical protein
MTTGEQRISDLHDAQPISVWMIHVDFAVPQDRPP